MEEVIWTKTDRLETIWTDAKDRCSNGAQYNLLLAYDFPIDLTDSSFTKAFDEKARKWLSDQVDPSLHFTHGKYFQGERGRNFIIEELKRKRTSRRALLCLLSMDEILNSEDEPIPAEAILQFGIADHILFVTAYFRALEVSHFLPINLTEICAHCQRIHQSIGDFDTVRLTLLAFRAYQENDFRCLEKAEIDQQPKGSVGVAGYKRDAETIKGWLLDKKRPDSVVCTDGLNELLNGAQLLNLEQENSYSPIFVSAIKGAIVELEKLRECRRAKSEGTVLSGTIVRFNEQIDKAVRELG